MRERDPEETETKDNRSIKDKKGHTQQRAAP